MLLKLRPMMAAFGAIFQVAPGLLAVARISADIEENILIKIAPALSMGVHENFIAVTSSRSISAMDINQTLIGWMNFAACGNAERGTAFDCIRELELDTEGEQVTILRY